MTAYEAASEMTTTTHHSHHHYNHFNETTANNYYNSKTILDEKLKVTTIINNNNLNNQYLPQSPSFMCLTPTSNSSTASVNSNKPSSNENITTTVQSNTNNNNNNNNTNNNNQVAIVQQSEKSNIDKYETFKQKKENDIFNQRLIEFHKHRNINSPLISWPTLNGKPIDLYKLYTKVVSLGGWERVCEKERWLDVGLELDENLFATCTMGSHALKIIYIRYLSSFEKVVQSLSLTQPGINVLKPTQFDANLINLYLNNLNSSQINLLLNGNNPNGSTGSLAMSSSSSNLLGYHKTSSNRLADFNDELGDESNHHRRRFSYLIDSTQMSYNYNQHNTMNLQDDSTQINKNQLTFNPYEKLEVSLLSGLPNEVDFSFNTLLLLSSDDNNMFRVYSSQRLIDLMLAHLGFFGLNDKFRYQNLYDNVWYANASSSASSKDLNFYLNNEEKTDDRTLKRYFKQYWHNYIKLTNDLNENEQKLFKSLLPKLNNESSFDNLPSQELMSLRDYYDSENQMYKVELRRIEQCLVILNNLSFEETNADFMANKCPTLIEFLAMCLFSTNEDIKKHSLDIFVNISRKLKLKKLTKKHQLLVLKSIQHLIMGDQSIKLSIVQPGTIMKSISVDRVELVRGIEILTKLCCQQISLTDMEDFSNEKHLAVYELADDEDNNENSCLYLEKLVPCFEQLLLVPDVLVTINTLECLYSLTQNSESICNIIMNNIDNNSSSSNSSLISLLVNILTLDMSHFGSTEINNNNGLKMYKTIPPSGLAINNNNINNNNNSSNLNQQTINNQNKSTTLLQQTLNNQLQDKLAKSSQNNNLVSYSNKNSSQEQDAKNVLCNWLITCFQADPKSELSKTQLYPYYQQIAKMNNWSVLPIPTFFDILNATFPNLRYDDTTNKILGLKLVLNVKQQLQLKQQQQQHQQKHSINITVNPIETQNKLPHVPVPQTQSAHNATTTEQLLSPPPSVSINIQVPSIPLLTPPTPPVTGGGQSTNNNKTVETDKTNEIKMNGNLTNHKEEEIINNIDSKLNKLNKSNIVVNGFNKEETKLTNGDLNNHDENSQSSTYSSASSTTSSLLLTKADDLNTGLAPTTNSTNQDASKKRKQDEVKSEDVEMNNHNNTNTTNNKNEENDEKENKSIENNNTNDDKNSQVKKLKDENNISNPIQISNQNGTLNQEATFNASFPTNQQPMQPYVPAPATNLINALKSNTPINGMVSPQQQQSPVEQTGEYMCEWNNCRKFFPTSKAVYNHVCKYHLLSNNNELVNCGSGGGSLCLWSQCDQIKRQKWSLVNHLQEKHCNENVMKAAIVLRKRGITNTGQLINQQNSTSSALNLNKDAAMFAIKRNQIVRREDFMVSLLLFIHTILFLIVQIFLIFIDIRRRSNNKEHASLISSHIT